MNIESVLYKIKLFEELVIESGMKRDIQDFIQSISQQQNRNLVFMKELSGKLKSYLIDIRNNSLGDDLYFVLKDSKPFTELNALEKLNNLDDDNEVDANQYFTQFNNLLSQLKNSINTNESEANTVKDFFSKYVTQKEEFEEEEDQGIMSLVFKDTKSTGSLKEFSKVLNRWNRTLLMYHTLIKSESPEEISLIEIQNGSIDVIFNIDIEVAVDLAKLITIGLKAYGAYLLYKSKTAKEIIESYMGNKKLIKGEEEREVLMLDNIKESMKQKTLEQHKEYLKLDSGIDKMGAAKKAEEVSNVLADHIIKGNELKLLTQPKEDGTEDENGEEIKKGLREETAIVRERFDRLKEEDKLLLLEKFTIKDE